MDLHTQARVQKLNASWRQYLSRALGMDDSTFKLAQGSLGLRTTDSSGLFSMADAVPPVTSVFNAAATTSFSNGYRSLLGALLPESGTDLPGMLGDDYRHWTCYRNAYFQLNPASSRTQEQVFETFAQQRLAPRLAQRAIAVVEAAAQTPLSVAFNASIAPESSQVFTGTSGHTQVLKKYSPTLDAARAALSAGAQLDIHYDSGHVARSLNSTEIEAAASGFYDIFSGGASGTFAQLNAKAAASGFTIKGHIKRCENVAVRRGGWFTSGEHLRAYDARSDDTVWDRQGSSGHWDSFFAQPNGGLARRVSQLLLVTDYELTVTSEATYSRAEHEKILRQSSFGIWPFFSASGSYSHTTDSKLTANGQLETTFTLDSGLVQIWGVNVLNAPA